MPSFSATDDILFAHAPGELTDLDPALLQSLQAEQFLLCQSCIAAVDQQAPAVRNAPDGTNLLTAYDPGQLVWTISARVLAWNGLADYRPGAALSRQALTFLNGPDYRMPFQFSDDGILVYEGARQNEAAGTLPEVTFSVRQVCGAGYDETAHPASPVPLVVLPFQSASVELHTTARHQLLLAVFNGADPFADEPLTATLYNGNPDTTGTPVTTCSDGGAWTTGLSEPDLPYRTQAANPEVLDFTDVSPSDATATWIKYECNGLAVAVAELDAPLAIPAGHAVRAPVGALLLHLTWPLDGDPLPSAADLPSRRFLPLALGAARASVIPAGTVEITLSDADFTTPTDFDIITAVPADGTHWTVSGLTVAPASISGTNTAGPGGWAIGSVKVNLTGVSTVLFREYYTASVSSGAAATLNTAPVLNLGLPPDP